MVSPLLVNDTATTEIYTLSLHDALPVLVGVVAAAGFFALGVRSAIAVLTLALTVFVAATIAVDFARATRARLRVGERLFPAMRGLLLRHNRRYGGFVVHLGILLIAVG